MFKQTFLKVFSHGEGICEQDPKHSSCLMMKKEMRLQQANLEKNVNAAFGWDENDWMKL